MQSRLPDVNTAFIKHRNSVIEGLRSMDYDKIFGSLSSWNALLPRNKNDDGKYVYRVVVSDQEFEELTKITTEAKCNNCKEYCDYNEIKIMDTVLPLVDSILSGHEKEKTWDCIKCNYTNRLSDTEIVEDAIKEPYFLGVVPKYPRRKDGLQDRHQYDRKVTQWAWNFIAELEEKSTQFREDYKENAKEFEAWDEEIDGGEESE